MHVPIHGRTFIDLASWYPESGGQASPSDFDTLSAQCRGDGWSEMAGGVTLFSRETFEELSAEAFAAELAGFAL